MKALLTTTLCTLGILVGLTPTTWAQPANDNIANAEVIPAIPVDIPGNTDGANTEPGELLPMLPCTFGNPIDSVWYSFDPAEAGTIDITLSGADDYVLSVHIGNSHPLTQVACIDAGGIGGNETLVGVSVAVGTVYLIRVAVFGPDVPLALGKGSAAQQTAFNLNVAVGSSLPVELVDFKVQVDGDDVILQWQTASETHNAGFEVQLKSALEADFVVRDFVEGAGTTRETQNYAYRIADLTPGTYTLRLMQMDFDGTFAYSPEVKATIEVPGTHVLYAAYPNPFNPRTQLSLAVGRDQNVRLEVYDATGRLVGVLFDGVLEANARHRFSFEASGLPSGLYIYRATGEVFTDAGKMMLLK